MQYNEKGKKANAQGRTENCITCEHKHSAPIIYFNKNQGGWHYVCIFCKSEHRALFHGDRTCACFARGCRYGG